MQIKKLISLLVITLLASSCGENYSNTKISYLEFGDAYLSGKDINLWSEIPYVYEGTTNINENPEQKTKEPLLIIDASEPIKITVLAAKEERSIINIRDDGREWLRIRYGSEEGVKVGFVGYSNVYSDKSSKILYAIRDNADDRIKISPKNYSTGNQLNLTKQYSQTTSSYYRDNDANYISMKTCDLYDSALISSSLEGLKKGEFETQQEFVDRKIALIKLINSTGAKEKIYAFSRSLSTKYFDYNVDTETLSINVLGFGVNHYCEKSYCGRDDKTLSNIKDIRLNQSSQHPSDGTGFDCPVNTNKNIAFELGREIPNLGDFNIEFNRKGRSNLGIFEHVKMDRDSARKLKETEGLKYQYIVGLSIVGHTFGGSQWTSRDCYGSYPNERCSVNEYGGFNFSSNIEYLILFDEAGNVVKSFFTNKYLNNFLQNDLLIQKHAYPNKSILKELNSLEPTEQLAKLFFNRMKKEVKRINKF
jgi:hypothetical protein